MWILLWWGGASYSNRDKHVLCEDNTLRLNDEEIDELVKITSKTVESGLGDGEILFGAKLGRQALTEESLAQNLSCHSNAKSHPCKLEAIS